MEETSSPQSPTPPVPQPPPVAPKQNSFSVLGGILTLTAIVLVIGGYVVWQGVSPDALPIEEEIGEPISEMPNSEDPYAMYQLPPYSTTGLDYSGPTEVIPVVWSGLVPITLNIGRVGTSTNDCDEFNWADYPTKFYKVGTVPSGKYAGGNVIVGIFNEGGYAGYCGFGMEVFRFIQNGANLTLIATSSSNYIYPLSDSAFSIDTHSAIFALHFPPTITYKGFTLRYERGWQTYFDTHYGRLFDYFATTTQVAFADPTFGNAYIEKPLVGEYAINQNAILFKAPDNTIAAYSLEIPFVDENLHVPNIMWNITGEPNIVEYSATDHGGCGAQNFLSVVHDIPRTDLIAAGVTSTGDTVYVLPWDHVYLRDLYGTEGYYGEYLVEQYPRYESFVASRPVFFWYDPLGRLVKFQRMDLLPAAECGKPVIYLYPTATTTVSVQVNPSGGFSFTEPEYGDGWHVVATPQGVLTNVADDTQYPYLFWEGRSNSIYETPSKGFVVAQADVHVFLLEKLAKLGLNAKESADFIEFWEPRMQDSPYYFVSFLGTKQMDILAPLTMSPKPDTIIRILMDFLPLEKPISVEGYEIKTPLRKGFTVIEWGGVLR